MKTYKAKQDYTDRESGTLVRAGETITATDERAEELRAAGVINVTPLSSEADTTAPKTPSKEK